MTNSTLQAAPAHPLKRLFGYARSYRADFVLASCYSVLNKFFDVLPEILIGVAVDVVVSRKDSFVAKFGITDPRTNSCAGDSTVTDKAGWGAAFATI